MSYDAVLRRSMIMSFVRLGRLRPKSEQSTSDNEKLPAVPLELQYVRDGSSNYNYTSSIIFTLFSYQPIVGHTPARLGADIIITSGLRA
jgi:hypothetical protein